MTVHTSVCVDIHADPFIGKSIRDRRSSSVKYFQLQDACEAPARVCACYTRLTGCNGADIPSLHAFPDILTSVRGPSAEAEVQAVASESHPWNETCEGCEEIQERQLSKQLRNYVSSLIASLGKTSVTRVPNICIYTKRDTDIAHSYH